MTATRELQQLGQSLWLDNISRELLMSGTLRQYINEFSVTGVTSNPTIFERAIGSSVCYDELVDQFAQAGIADEALCFELALADVKQAADLLQPIHSATHGADGWVSLEVSPWLADDVGAMVKSAINLHTSAAKANVLIKIPGTMAGLRAVEETIFSGVPVNVTLLFSREHYLAAADAYCRGIERRLSAGLNPGVHSVASLFVSRWDVAANERVPHELHNHLGIAIAMRTYKAYRDLLAAPRWQRLAEQGAPAQRLLWASTGTKDPEAAETLYVEALAAGDTINTLPERSLLAFADYGKVTTSLPLDGGNAEEVIDKFERLGINVDALAKKLQREGTLAFADSWRALLDSLASKQHLFRRGRRQVG